MENGEAVDGASTVIGTWAARENFESGGRGDKEEGRGGDEYIYSKNFSLANCQKSLKEN